MTDKTNPEKPVQLTDDATPLSTRMNWPLLSGRKSNIELKTDDPTPLSSQMKWPLLSGRKSNIELMTGNPTPFSAMMKWPVLSDKTMFNSDLSTGASSSGSGDSPVSRFLRQIVTGEVQK
ncbi:MAG: hypothetical protein JXJ18_03360 [Rhodobacteraceae bacterium]|nr:hypothetical protein [Paracoccaceae bacterium]